MSQRGQYLSELKQSGKLKRIFALDKAALNTEAELSKEPWKDLAELFVSDGPQRVKAYVASFFMLSWLRV